MSSEELGDTYGKKMGFFRKLLITQGVKSIKQGNSMVQYIFLKIIYVRSKKFYVEHLIFSFHYHAFIFLIFTMVILLIPYLGGGIIGLGFFIAFVYLFIALKRIYQQGWFKTLLKIFIISLIYLVLLTIFMCKKRVAKSK